MTADSPDTTHRFCLRLNTCLEQNENVKRTNENSFVALCSSLLGAICWFEEEIKKNREEFV